jgi:hypothetical protein
MFYGSYLRSSQARWLYPAAFPHIAELDIAHICKVLSGSGCSFPSHGVRMMLNQLVESGGTIALDSTV